MQGTISILIGCHSPMHSLLVLIAWVKLYGVFPRPWQVACIFLHDIGHMGKNYLDDVDAKNEHWRLGARIAGWLFGQKGYDLCAGHNIHSGALESLLSKPDKYSYLLAPEWWLWTNTLFEPKLAMGYTRREAIRRFRERVRESIETGKYHPTHEFYIERCREKGGDPE
jgi:hypothetical protein